MGAYPKNLDFRGALNLKVFSSLATLWRDGSAPFVNTPKDQALIPGHRFSFRVVLGAGVPVNQMPAAPFDPYLYVYNTGSEIHLPGGSGQSSDGQPIFTDATGYPFALIFPEGWQVPVEYTDLGLAYPDFIGFAAGEASKQDWYLRPAADRTKATTPAVWKW
jgi:LruC domain-containing protein